MKSKMLPKPPVPEAKFPRLVSYSDDDGIQFVILANGVGGNRNQYVSGTIVHIECNNCSWPLGSYHEDFEVSQFEDYVGSITLSS